jgi:hypothetical protein
MASEIAFRKRCLYNTIIGLRATAANIRDHDSKGLSSVNKSSVPTAVLEKE